MKIFSNILYFILAMGLGLLAGGCVNDYADEGCGVADVPDKVKVRFTLQLDDFGGSRGGGLSGGVWNNDYTSVAGTRFDSQIKRLHVMLIEDATDNVAHVMLDRYEYVADDGGYTFEGYIDMSAHTWTAGAYHVMVLANCGPAELGIAKKEYLKDAIDHVGWYNPDGSRIDSRHIPMWGTRPVNLTLTGETPEDIGSIDLLRAVAKVRIMLTNDMKKAGYTLQGATINHANAYIDPLPAGWDKADATADNGQRHGAPFNPVATPVTPKEFTPITTSAEGDDKAGTIVFYLPEYDSAAAAGEGEATIDVTLRHEATGQTLTYPAALKFDDPDINSGGTGGAERLATDIVRNHLYQFTIEGIDFGTLNYRVACWNHITSTLGWNSTGFKFSSSDSEAKVGFVSHPNYPKEGANIEYGTSYADYSFKLTGPTGAVWKAFLIEDGVAYAATRQFKEVGDKKGADTPGGFFFGDGNDDKNNKRAATTGIAGIEYNIKVGTRLCLVDYTGIDTGDKTNHPEEVDGYLPLSAEGTLWKEKGEVPTCYLVIKVAYDGVNFTEELPINPEASSGNYAPYKFPGDATRLEIRNLYCCKIESPGYDKINAGSNDKTNGIVQWWDYPMGHKNKNTEPVEPTEPTEPTPTEP